MSQEAIRQTRQKKPKISREMAALSDKVGAAIGDFDMIGDGDKIMVAVSGGKDSLMMARLLKYRQSFAPVDYELLAVHIDFSLQDSLSQELQDIFQKEGIAFHIEKVDFLKEGQTWDDINCFWCSWNRRKALFELAERSGFNKIALGHHLDDIAETILLNLFYHGQISAMCPTQELFDGKITLVRPLAYIEEEEIIRASSQNVLKDTFSCPHNDTSKRLQMKKILERMGSDASQVKKNILKSARRLDSRYLL